MRYFRVRNHSEFQHYKSGDRAKGPPPWIKLYFSCMSSYSFTNLTDAQKWHAVGLALLASQQDNHLPADARWLARELSASGRVRLEPLLAAGFIEWCECSNCNGYKPESGVNASSLLALPDSNPLASRARERREDEEERREEGDDARARDGWEAFWEAYPNHENELLAQRAYFDAESLLPPTEELVATVRGWAVSAKWTDRGGKFIPQAHNWLNRQQWRDPIPPPPKQKPGASDENRRQIRALD